MQGLKGNIDGYILTDKSRKECRKSVTNLCYFMNKIAKLI
jgi:hypothetical protein